MRLQVIDSANAQSFGEGQECNATGSVLYIVLWSLLVQLDSEPTTCGYDVVYETLVETENVCAEGCAWEL